MYKLFSTLFILAFVTLSGLPALAADTDKSPSETRQKRDLIYCADLMTHEERVAYRERMRAARTPQEKAEIRQAHQKEMRARAIERNLDPMECEPQHHRERLRQRGDKP